MAPLRQNELTGDWVLPVPERRHRPQGSQPKCPFCRGHESLTPPTLQQLPRQGDWSARAFENRYPSLEHHELIVDSARHVEKFHELTPAEVETTVQLWAQRLRALRDEWPYFLLYRNDGTRAGASIPHTHTQIAATAQALPRLLYEVRIFESRCPFESDAFWRVQKTHASMRVGEPKGARFPSEVWIFPASHTPNFDQSAAPILQAFAQTLRNETIRLVQSGFDSYNVILHTAPRGASNFHWHAEILPRRDGIAGFELGSGIYLNAGP